MTLLRRSGGDGHIIIYEVDKSNVNVLHVYHTKMDVRGRIEKEFG